MNLSIEQFGLTYSIELTRAGSGAYMEALLSEDSDGWKLAETTRGTDRDTTRIGRRKRWQDALAEALILMENTLIEREASL